MKKQMINRNAFALIALLSFWLFTAACTAAAEPAAETTPAVEIAVTMDPTTAPTAAPDLDPTPAEEPEPTAVPTETAVAPDDLSSFASSFQMALAQREFDLVQGQMSDPFGFGPYRSEWSQLTPAEMVAQLENILPPGAALQFNPEADLMMMLDGQDPHMMLGPDVTVAAVWHTTGWGAEGQDEAILFIEEMMDGRFAWKAMIYAPNGFLPESAELPILDEQPAPVGLLYADNKGFIWQITVDGQPRQISAGGIPSPDGKHILYEVQEELWLLNLATDERTQLTSKADGVHLAGTKQWADNETILAGIWLDLETEGGPNSGHPALINIGGGELKLLDEPFQLLMRGIPAVSSTGDVAFDTVGRSADDNDFTWIYEPGTGVMTFEAGDFANAAENAGYTSPAWSADGRFLTWLAFTGNNVNHLAVFDLESGTVVNLPNYQGIGFGGPYPSPVISPDPNWIALRQLTNDPTTTGLWLYTLDGQVPVFIAQNGGESLWVNEHLLLFIDYDENFNAQLQQYDTLTGVRSVVTLPDVFQIFGIVE